MDALLKRLSRIGLRRALAGEHWAWLALAAAAFLLRRARRPEEATTTLALAPGEHYLVTLVPPGDRRGRAGALPGEVAVADSAGAGGAGTTGP